MKNKSISYAVIGAFVSLLSSVVHAGPGANVQACIYLQVDEMDPLHVAFKSGGSGDICMNSHGKDAQLTVSKAGLTCTSVGYVEGQVTGSGCMLTKDSIWNLSYSVNGKPYNGSIKSTWWYNADLGYNKVEVMSASGGTTICAAPALCPAPNSDSGPLKWKNQGPLYFIFPIGH